MRANAPFWDQSTGYARKRETAAARVVKDLDGVPVEDVDFVTVLQQAGHVIGVNLRCCVLCWVRNVTGSSDLCSCTVGACTIAANTPTACTCSGTFTAASLYTMRLSSSTDCGANPQNIICTASVIP
jgi:hypothetical protein